ncbi:MAG: hypothetical protein M3O09_04645 [Acidobacteriota bacterium]|nr:hypothetical protein [Acidobacteriota bacterium]
MARCKVDCSSSPTLAKLLRKLRKKYRHIESDLAAVVPEIEADYTRNCNAARPPKRKIGIEHWKYDFGSTDLQRSPRNSFRVIGIFLEGEQEGKERTLYLCIAYFKGDQDDVSEQEVLNAVAELREAITQGDLAGNSE